MRDVIGHRRTCDVGEVLPAEYHSIEMRVADLTTGTIWQVRFGGSCRRTILLGATGMSSSTRVKTFRHK